MQICYIPAPKKNYQSRKFQQQVATFTRDLKHELKGCNAKEKLEVSTAIIAYAMFEINTLAASAPTNGIDHAGQIIMSYIKPIAFWLGVIFAGIDVVKNIKNQDIWAIPKIVARYAIMVAAVWNMPRIFQFLIKMIGDCFTVE